MFDFWVGKPVSQGSPEGLIRLRRLVSATCLRRTKDSVREALNLPARTVRECAVHLDQEDKELYDFFKKSASHLIAYMVTESDNPPRTGNILPIINTLRLICNHGRSLLPKFALTAWGQRYNPTTYSELATTKPRLCFSCGMEVCSQDMQSEFACPHLLCSNCADTDEKLLSSLDSVVCPQCAINGGSVTSVDEPGRKGNYQPSAKVRALVQNLRDEQQNKPLSFDSRPIKRSVYWRTLSVRC